MIDTVNNTMTNVPFKLIISMYNPIIMTHPVTLDALLIEALHNSGLSYEDCFAAVPLEREDDIFKASAMFCKPGYTITPVTKIMALKSGDKVRENFAPNGGRGKNATYSFIDDKRGAFKSNMTTYLAKDSSEVYFWGVGDPTKVVALLKNYIPCLGKRCATGQGQIRDIECIELDDDYSWKTEKGDPARPLPVSLWDNSDTPELMTTVNYPYWETANNVKAVYPSAWVI